MKSNLILALALVLSFIGQAHADTAAKNADYVSAACFKEIRKAVLPSLAHVVRDRHVEISDQGMPLAEAKGKTASGETIYYKSMWKAVPTDNDAGGYFHTNVGVFLELTKNSCNVIGVNLTPDLF